MRITQLCFGHMFPVMAALLLLLLSGVRCEELTALNPELWTQQGANVSLGYSYHKYPAYDDYFFWYRQYPGKPLEFLASHPGTEAVMTENEKGVKFEVKKRDIHLLLSPAAVADSAVYYCAVRPTVTANPQSLNKNLWRGNSSTPHIHQRETLCSTFSDCSSKASPASPPKQHQVFPTVKFGGGTWCGAVHKQQQEKCKSAFRKRKSCCHSGHTIT